MGKMNLDLPHMYEYGYATMPAKPDLLVFSSTLKPFAKVSRSNTLDCINSAKIVCQLF